MTAADDLAAGLPRSADAPAWIREGGPTCAPERLFGVSVTDAGHGWVDGEMIVPEGVGVETPLPRGFLGMLADVALGRSVQSTLPVGDLCRTARLALDLTGARVVAGQRLRARGQVLARHGTLRLASCDVLTPNGRLAARATGWFAVAHDDPSACEPAGVAGPDLDRFRPLALDALVALLAGIPREDRPGRFELLVHPRAETANRSGIVHGGVLVGLTEAVLSQTARCTTELEPRIVHLGMTLHRPVPAGGPPVTATGEVSRAGRRVLALTGALVSATGSLLLSASATVDCSP